MELEIYHYSLCVSLTLLLFFSFRFLFGKLPDKQIFRQYRISRMLMGIALLDLAANYSVHLFLTPRLAAPINAILMNLCTYWLAVWLFGSALMMLLDKRYVTRKRFIRHIAGWMAYCIVVLILWCYVPSSLLYSIVPILLAVAFCVYAVGVAHKVCNVPQGNLQARQLLFRRCCCIHSLDVGFHILGYCIWSGAGYIYFCSRPLCILMDNFGYTFLYILICFVCQLSAHVRTCG